MDKGLEKTFLTRDLKRHFLKKKYTNDQKAQAKDV